MSYEKIAFELNKAKVFSKLSDIKIRGKTLTLTVSSPKKHFEWIGLMLGYNWKIEEDREDYFLKPDGFRDTGKRIEIDCTIDLETFPFRMTHWSFYAVYKCDGIYYYSKVLLGSKKKESRLQFLLSKDYYKTGDGHIVFVYIGSGKQVMLRFRESASYDNRLFRASNRQRDVVRSIPIICGGLCKLRLLFRRILIRPLFILVNLRSAALCGCGLRFIDDINIISESLPVIIII